MERESANPEFAFMFNLQTPEHMYFRWRLYSLAQGASALSLLASSSTLLLISCSLLGTFAVDMQRDAVNRGSCMQMRTFAAATTLHAGTARMTASRLDPLWWTIDCRRHAARMARGAVCHAGGWATVGAAAHDACGCQDAPPDSGAARRRGQGRFLKSRRQVNYLLCHLTKRTPVCGFTKFNALPPGG